jgi:hypothetical protein
VHRVLLALGALADGGAADAVLLHGHQCTDRDAPLVRLKHPPHPTLNVERVHAVVVLARPKGVFVHELGPGVVDQQRKQLLRQVVGQHTPLFLRVVVQLQHDHLVVVLGALVKVDDAYARVHIPAVDGAYAANVGEW